MNDSDTINYLKQAKRLDDIINLKIEQLSDLKLQSTAISSLHDTEKVKTSLNPNQLSGLVAKMVDLENEINKEIDKLYSVKKDIMHSINLIDNKDYQVLLNLRYLNFLTWEEIAAKMRYSIRWIYKMHKEAIMKIKLCSKVQ